MIKLGSMTLSKIPGRTAKKKMTKTRYWSAASESLMFKNWSGRRSVSGNDYAGSSLLTVRPTIRAIEICWKSRVKP